MQDILSFWSACVWKILILLTNEQDNWIVVAQNYGKFLGSYTAYKIMILYIPSYVSSIVHWWRVIVCHNFVYL